MTPARFFVRLMGRSSKGLGLRGAASRGALR